MFSFFDSALNFSMSAQDELPNRSILSRLLSAIEDEMVFFSIFQRLFEQFSFFICFCRDSRCLHFVYVLAPGGKQ